MNAKKLVALVLAVAFAVQVGKPKPARADNTGLIIGVSIAAYLAVVGVCTYLIYNRRTPVSSTSLLPEPQASREASRPGQIRVGTDCAPNGSSTVWLCW